MSAGARIIVVGAGIVGAAVAEALAMDGHRVTVVDRGSIGGGATAAGMGHVVVMGRFRRAVQSHVLQSTALERARSKITDGS